ncbi:MAG: ChaB family protein [Hyphomicrobium sp.]|nr:ChaB family protein [Hyphomicrobium sp.]
MAVGDGRVGFREPVDTSRDVDEVHGACAPFLRAQEIYRGAFNGAWLSYDNQPPDKREVTAHRIAWAAVKRRYRKEAGQWEER